MQPIFLFCQDDEEDDCSVVETPTGSQQLEKNAGGQSNGQMLTNGQIGDSWQNNALQSTEEDQEMALQFSTWFYQMLNACNPIYLNHISQAKHFGPQHFFHDANLSMLFFDRENRQKEDVSQADVVCKRLSSLTSEQRLVFNPNLEPTGVKGLSDPHGLRVVIVCGTVHTSSEVVGPFEQQFGLVRDPFSENNWKIKFTRLAVSTDRVSGLPTLDFTRRALST